MNKLHLKRIRWTMILVALGALLLTAPSYAWWSVPFYVYESVHHKLIDGARYEILWGTSKSDKYADLVGKYSSDISDWTSGSWDDERAHANNGARNDGPILTWWGYALEQYKLFRFTGSGDPMSYDRPGVYY